MSVARGVPGEDGPQAGQKIVLPRSHEMWSTIQEHWAGDVQVRWKALAMLHLQVHCGWSLSMIGRAFGQCRGRVSRLTHNAKRQLAEEFIPEPPRIEPEDEDAIVFPED